MAVSCIVYEKPNKVSLLVENYEFFIPSFAFEAPGRGSPSDYCHTVLFGVKELELCGYPKVKKV